MPDRSFLTWPFFEPRHVEFAEIFENWCRRNLDYVEHDDVDETCRKLVRQLSENGYLKFVTDPSLGDVRYLCLIRETLARYSGLADFTFAMQGLGFRPILLFGGEDTRKQYAVKTVNGAIAAFAITEPEAGSDVSALRMTATSHNGGYLLNGTKTFISNGGIADYYTVFVRTGEAPGAKGLSAFIVDADNPGLSIKERIQVMAPHPLATLEFKDCWVPESHLLGKPGDGFKIAMSTLDIFRPTVGAAALGFARRALDEAIQRTTERKLFGAPLADMQMTQAKIADMALEIDASALLIYRAAWMKDQGAMRITREAAMAKLYATEAAQRVIDQAVQLYGGLGVVSGNPVEILYREIRALRIYEGASEVQQQIIARTVFQENS